MSHPTLDWGPWCEHYAYRSWDACLDMRTACTPFGAYKLLRRHAWPGSRTIDNGKWFVERPGACSLGPFPDDVTAARAAVQDYRDRAAMIYRGDYREPPARGTAS